MSLIRFILDLQAYRCVHKIFELSFGYHRFSFHTNVDSDCDSYLKIAIHTPRIYIS